MNFSVLLRVLRIHGFAKNMIRIESHGFANPMDSHGFAVLRILRIQNWIRKSANPSESQDSHGFDESWIRSDSGFAKWKFCESMDSQHKKNRRFCESIFLGFARFSVYANPGIRIYANPCESKFLL